MAPERVPGRRAEKDVDLGTGGARMNRGFDWGGSGPRWVSTLVSTWFGVGLGGWFPKHQRDDE